MLVRCKEGCKQKATTNAVLDIETNQAVCEYCGDVLSHISDYGKAAMKNNGDVLKKKKAKPFTFRCTSCKQEQQAVSNNGLISGLNCKTPKDCNFNISEYMKHSVAMFSLKDDEDSFESQQPNSEDEYEEDP